MMAAEFSTRVERLLQLGQREFGSFFNPGREDLITVRAPGRVNLIGGHTDYNQGYVLPVAIDRELWAAIVPREDSLVKVYSSHYGERAAFDLNRIKYDEKNDWLNYLQGVALFLQEEGSQLSGLNVVLQGNLPQGAGLSSSAALEMVLAFGWKLVDGLAQSRVELAHICRRAENQFVGVSCGIMDQFISALGQRDRALFLDCRSQEYEYVPVSSSPEEEMKILVADTGVSHKLSASGYNRRREECQQGVEFFNQRLDRELRSLRDLSWEDFMAFKAALPDQLGDRCQHVLSENERVKKCCKALKEGNLPLAGELITRSHYSLRDLFQVSCYELDLMVELALQVEGVYGSRMTGAGFGGSTVNLVEGSSVDSFKERLTEGYLAQTGLKPEIYVCQIAEGCSILAQEGDRG